MADAPDGPMDGMQQVPGLHGKRVLVTGDCQQEAFTALH